MGDVSAAVDETANNEISAPPSGNLPMGILAGVIAALLGAVAWAVVTVVTHYQIGFMAVGVGFLVGIAVRKFGHGSAVAFGVVGAALSLVGCLLGNLFATYEFIAEQEKTAFFAVVAAIPFGSIPSILAETFDVMDVLFYGIAIYEGFKLSIARET